MFGGFQTVVLLSFHGLETPLEMSLSHLCGCLSFFVALTEKVSTEHNTWAKWYHKLEIYTV